MFFQLQHPDYLRMQAVEQMRHGDAKTRSELKAAAGAADFGLGFEHEHLAAGSREKGGTDETVVAAAYDDRIK
jgi:hypothetical protein